MTKLMRQKIITYQSDLGYQLLTKRVQGLIKLGMTVRRVQKRVAFEGVNRKVERVEEIGRACEKMSGVYRQRRSLKEWLAALAWHRRMISLSLKAHEYRQKGEQLLQKLIIENMRKVMKQERKWLNNAKHQL